MLLKSQQIRLSPQLAEEVTKAAKRNGVSANGYMIAAIEAALRRERDEQWRRGFEAMAGDADAGDVEYAIGAQSEVALDTPYD